MLRLAFRELWAKKFRFALTAFAIMLGVSFLTGMLTVSDTIRKSLDDLSVKLFANVDVVVEGAVTFRIESGPQTIDQRLVPPDAALIEVIRAVPGVEKVVSQYLFTAEISTFKEVTENGSKVQRWTPVRDNTQDGAPQFGFNWEEDRGFFEFEIAEGRKPSSASEVVLDKAVATKGKVGLGSKVQIRVSETTTEYTVVGIAKFGDADSAVGATAAIFDLPTAKDLYLTTVPAGSTEKVQSFAVRGDGSLSRVELADAVYNAINDPGVDVKTGDEAAAEMQDQFGDQLSFLTIFLLAFAVIAILVSVFIIYNSFAIIVAQRVRQLALLRAVGARGSQILWSVALEALVVGAIASVIGVFVGLGIASFMMFVLRASGGDMPPTALVLTPMTIAIALIVGVFVTTAAALMPAITAARVPPIAAITGAAYERVRRLRLRTTIGFVLLALGAFVALNAAWNEPSDDTLKAALGLLLVAGSAILLLPVALRPLARAMGAIVRPFRGIPAQIAADNAARSPRRTGRTAAALMVGITLVSFNVVALDSITASFDEIIDASVQGDLIVQDGNINGAEQVDTGLSETAVEAIRAVPGVALATGISGVPFELRRDGIPINRSTASPELVGEITRTNKPAPLSAQFGGVANLATLEQLSDYQVVEGSFADAQERGIAMSSSLMTDYQLNLGDTVELYLPQSETTVSATLGARYDFDLFGNIYLSDTLLRDAGIPVPYAFTYIKVDDGADLKQVEQAVAEVVRAESNSAKVADLAGFKEAQAAQVNQFLAFLLVMLFLALFIAVIGIVNTLSLATVERHREIGLLRGVGMSRGQVRSMIRWEAVVMSLIGTVLGLAVGIFGAWAVMATLQSEDLNVFRIPYMWVGIIAVVGAVFGVLASLWPAFRAARRNMLQSMAVD